jgi:hypothetical protein
MPELFPSTKHPFQPARLNTSTKLHDGITPAAKQTVQVCSSFKRRLEYFWTA